ncbi:MAG: hypothetical protein R6W83_06630, partial [Cryobacterium sp.]
HWSTPPAGGRLTPHDGLAQDAADVFAHAALEWLSRAEDSLTAVGSAAYAHGLNPDRPRRGRRPSAPAPSAAASASSSSSSSSSSASASASASA